MRRRPRPAARWPARGGAALLGAALCLAGAGAGAGEILHEYVPPPPLARGPTAGQEPPPFLPPEEGARPQPGEAVQGQSPEGARAEAVRLDRRTTQDGVLRYSARFEPSVVPFKRGAAFDAVGADYSLSVRDPSLRPLPERPRPTPPDRTAFWGSVMVQLQADGRPTPLPSVAPGIHLLEAQAVPPLALTFHTDGADNLWVRGPRPGRARLRFLSDAPRSYFSAQLPAQVTAEDVAPGLRPRLPPAVARAARQVLARLGLRAGQRLAWQLGRLAAYFRGFQEGPLPRVTRDLYLDIALGQRGVCRHRAFAFVVTAQALGIPARYVHNEAHAFAEAFLPRAGWLRVDLGGASRGLQVQSASARSVHDPGPDPLPRPRRYERSYSQLPTGGQITGLREDQRRGARASAELIRLRTSSAGPGTAPASADDAADPGAPAAALAAPASPPLPRPQIQLQSPDRTVLRGQTVRVRGRVTHLGVGVARLPLQILITADGRLARRVGLLLSGADGAFAGELSIPRDVPVGEYLLVASTPGDERFGPARSR